MLMLGELFVRDNSTGKGKEREDVCCHFMLFYFRFPREHFVVHMKLFINVLAGLIKQFPGSYADRTWRLDVPHSWFNPYLLVQGSKVTSSGSWSHW